MFRNDPYLHVLSLSFTSLLENGLFREEKLPPMLRRSDRRSGGGGTLQKNQENLGGLEISIKIQGGIC